MIEPKRNLYKAPDIFRCRHDVHRPFKSAMSPFHILQQKQCYPHGCVTFIWKCRLLAKHKKCFRGFEHVGRKCFNCRYFYEEKQHQYPEFRQNGQSAEEFMAAFAEFEDWVHDLQQRRVLAEGTIRAVTPQLFFIPHKEGQNLQARGFLARFDQGYIDNQPFEDPFYLSLSPLSQNQLQLRPDDQVEFEAQLHIDRGRFKFHKGGRFHFMQRGQQQALRKADITVALQTYTIQDGQPGKCLSCAHGVLAERIVDAPARSDKKDKNGPTRLLICLQGVRDYKDCIMHLPANGSGSDRCANTNWDGTQNCHHVL